MYTAQYVHIWGWYVIMALILSHLNYKHIPVSTRQDQTEVLKHSNTHAQSK